jgi:hypothetical protein
MFFKRLDIVLPVLLVWQLPGCSSSTRVQHQDPRHTLVAIIEGLGLFDSLIPVGADSVLELYRKFDPTTFQSVYKSEVSNVRDFVDSMNASLDPSSRINTLAIDHSLENFGNAARVGNTLFLSSSYFFLFNNLSVLHSVITHEYGHIHYGKLSASQRQELYGIWAELKDHALFYLFRDGEYSGNAKFGGHPYDSPAELFASGFNLYLNRTEELKARLQYVDPGNLRLVKRFEEIVRAEAARPPSPPQGD